MPRPYPAEFRARAVALVRAGKQQTATELGIHPVTLSKWIKQDRIDRGEIPGVSIGEPAEVRTPRSRIRGLETKLLIVRQAVLALGEDRSQPKGSGDRTPGVRARSVDPFAPFLAYVTVRLSQDPHLWALTLFDELLALGFTASYPTRTREIRARRLRPVCADCATATGRVNAIIDHPPGVEMQWDSLDLPDPPAAGVGPHCAPADVLVDTTVAAAPPAGPTNRRRATSPSRPGGRPRAR